MKINDVIILKNATDRANRRYSDLNSIKSQIIDGTFGQFGISQNSHIEISKISHKISNARVIDNNLIVDIETLPTPYGIELEKLLNMNCVQTSLNGTGFVTHVDDYYEVSNYKFISINYIEGVNTDD